MADSPEQSARRSVANSPHGVVRWGHGPLCFELRSHDEEVLSRVKAVVGSWPAPAGGTLARRWRVERIAPHTDEVRWEGWVSGPDERAATRVGPAAPAALLQAVEFDGVKELLDCREDVFALHAALVSRQTAAGERGVALIGPCFSGKSTFSCALWNSGWSFLGDDVAFVDPEGHASAAPRRAWMRETSRDLVGEALWTRAEMTPAADRTPDSLLFHPHEVDGRARPERTRLAAIVFLSRYNAKAGPAELHAISAVDGAIALMPYSNLREVPFPEALSRIAPVAEHVPIYDIGRGPLDAMIGELNRLLDSAAR
jgi:hypothetical protein